MLGLAGLSFPILTITRKNRGYKHTLDSHGIPTGYLMYCGGNVYDKELKKQSVSVWFYLTLVPAGTINLQASFRLKGVFPLSAANLLYTKHTGTQVGCNRIVYHLLVVSASPQEPSSYSIFIQKQYHI